jgi:O-acetylserine/cysteine efflux transporter
LLLSALLEGPQVASLPATVTLRGVAALLYIAFIASVLGYWLWFRLIQQYPVSQISMFAMLSPVFSFVTGYVLLNEEWTVVKLSGAGLVLLALYVANTGRVLVFGRAAPTPPSTASRPR